MSVETPLSESLENYLEAIYHITEAKAAARPKDLVRAMQVGSSSVTGALQVLAERGLVNYAPFDLVTLTDSGRRAARSVVRRHEVLHDFLVKVLGVSGPEADDAACRMEHALAPGMRERLTRFVDWFENCPSAGADCFERFSRECAQGEDGAECRACMARRAQVWPGRERRRNV